MRPRPERDLGLLVPAFRERLESMLGLLRHLGHEPRVWETWRSVERAEWLAAHGSGMTSGTRSMHLYGIAADVICDREHDSGPRAGEPHMWGCPRDCDFFAAIGRAAKAEGLTWGGDWGRRDLPHVQAIPVSLQDELRAAPYPAAYATAYLRGRLEAAA